jgi:hypothetical protein
MTTTQLLSILPANYELHTNDNTVYNANGNDFVGDDYSIEIIGDVFEVRHTGGTVAFDTVDDLLAYVS